MIAAPRCAQLDANRMRAAQRTESGLQAHPLILLRSESRYPRAEPGDGAPRGANLRCKFIHMHRHKS
jgi:hypothetical protein